MGNYISNPTIPSLLTAPLQLMTAWFVPRHSKARTDHPAEQSRQMALPFSCDPADVSTGFKTSGKPSGNPEVLVNGPIKKLNVKSPLRSGLRVVRVVDSGDSPSCAGRMVISGRISDVCAELERMSQVQDLAR